MIAADTVLAKLIENLAELLPCRIVHNYEQGLKFSFGKPVKLCRTGIHFFWPFIQSIYVTSGTLEVVVDLAEQSYFGVTFQGTIGYRLTDLFKVWTTVYDVERSLKNTAEGLLAQAVMDRGSPLTQGDARELCDEVLEALRAEGESWGVEVTRFYLPNVTSAVSVRHFGSLPH